MEVEDSGSRPGSAKGNLVIITGDIGFFTSLRVTELRVLELDSPPAKKVCLLVPRL